MKEREKSELKGAWDQGTWLKVLLWELQKKGSYSSISWALVLGDLNFKWISYKRRIRKKDNKSSGTNSMEF